MNKTELIAAVAAKAGIEKKTADKAVNATLEAITDGLVKSASAHLRFVSARLRLPVTPRPAKPLRLRLQRFPYSRQAQVSKRRLQSARQRILNNCFQKWLPFTGSRIFLGRL